MRNLHDRIRTLAIGEVLHQVVVGDTRCNDTEVLLGTVEILIEARGLRSLRESGLLVNKVAVETFGVGRQQHERLGVGGLGKLVLRTHGFAHHASTAVGQTGRNAIQHWRAEFLTQVVTIVHHVVGFLLVRRLQHGDHSPMTIEAAVLFVLRREHARVVGYHNENAFGTNDGSVHEGVATDVETHVLHAGHSAFASVGHTDGGLEGCLLVSAPVGNHAEFLGLLRVDDILCDLG